VKIFTAILLSLLCAGAQAQMHHDPLNDREVDQLRDNAQDAKKRVDLLVAFSRDRMLAIDRLRSATKQGIDDSSKIADLLSDLAALIDELDDNLAMYNGHSEDLRRPLRHVLDAEAEFQKKLTSLNDNATPLQKRRFAAALEDASDSLKTSTESARAMLADQLQKKGEEKNKEKLDRQDAKQMPGTNPSDAEHRQPPDYTGMGGVGRKPPQQ
jgi:DNA repair exonuclease SbcCD ATPase subunit